MTNSADLLVNEGAITDSQVSPSITYLSDGGWIIAWQSGRAGESSRDLYFRFYEEDGTESDAPQIFRSDPLPNSGLEIGGLETFLLSNGNIVIVWTEYDPSDISRNFKAIIIDSDGNTVRSEFDLNAPIDGNYIQIDCAELADGGWIAVYRSDYYDPGDWDVYAQRFDVNGDRVGLEYRINQSVSGEQFYQSVTALTDGRIVVQWTDTTSPDGSDIFARVLDEYGVPIGNEFQVNTTTAGDQFVRNADSIIATSDGGFVVFWSAPDGSILMQRFDDNVQKVGGEIIVTEAPVAGTVFQAAALLEDGGWVAVYMIPEKDGDGPGLFAQRFADDGTKVGSEFQVNTQTAGQQGQLLDIDVGAAEVIAKADGGWVITWSGETDGDAFGLYSKVYDSAGNANNVPRGEVTISGDAVRGETLTADVSLIVDPDGIDGQTTIYQWLRNGEPIDGATAGTYVVTSKDQKAVLSVEYSYTDDFGTYEVVVSDPTEEVPTGKGGDDGENPPGGGVGKGGNGKGKWADTTVDEFEFKTSTLSGQESANTQQNVEGLESSLFPGNTFSSLDGSSPLGILVANLIEESDQPGVLHLEDDFLF